MKVIESVPQDVMHERLSAFPLMRYMGSKHKLLPWIYDTLKDINFTTTLDAFSGSSAVSYMLKAMGKKVYSNDFLHFSYLISKGIVENNASILDEKDLSMLMDSEAPSNNFIATTFKDVFYTKNELVFLDKLSANIINLESNHKRALAYAALFRACIKKQPRGVFTVSGNLDRYDDGRRDLRLSLPEHFLEQVAIYNKLVFDNGQDNISFNQSIFEFNHTLYPPDLVYMDPPYVPRSDDNCYVKQYHFLEGLSKYWEGEPIMHDTKVKKIKKKFTPFSYRHTSLAAFNEMFMKFRNSTLVLSYSSNAYPDLKTLVTLMKKVKKEVNIYEKSHRYHFGNHTKVQRCRFILVYKPIIKY